MSTWENMIALATACGKRALESLPDKLAESPAGAAGAAGLSAIGVFPAAVVIGGVADLALKHYEDRARPGALAELFRESLLHALRACPPAPDTLFGASEADLALLLLWTEGLESHDDSDPGWIAFLKEAVPLELVRAVSIEVGDETSYWPSLRALLARCTRWFQPDGAPLKISPYLERHLAQRLTPAFLEHFLPKLVSRANKEEFNEALLSLLGRINAELAPLDPLRTLDNMRGERGPSKHIDFLIARYRAIPYAGRGENIEQMWEWLNSAEPVSLQVVIGRGGSGKTRFAYEFLEEIERRALGVWHAGFVDLDEFAKLDAERFRYWRGRKPTLIVLDYAASATAILTRQVLPRLYNYCLANSPTAPRLRFLLLERAADERQGWYRDLLLEAREREKDLFPSAPLRLADLGPDDRLILINGLLRALHAFDTRAGSPITAPPELADPIRTHPALDPLVLAMAALVAHERHEFSPTFDLDRLDLAREVAKHEERRIKRLAEAAGREGHLLLHMAAFITLTGSLSAAELEQACETERQHVASHSNWTDDLYTVLNTQALPPEKETMAADPVVPDIVGEALIARILLARDHKAEETVVRASQIKPGEVTRSLRRIVQDFAPASPGGAEAEVPEQKWALTLLTNLLRVRSRVLTDTDFWAIQAELPMQSLSMSGAALEFYKAVAESRPSGLKADSPDRVALAARESQAIHASAFGDRAEALHIAEPVVSIRRGLAEANPDAFLPDLAMSLNNQATMQSAMGQREEALRSISEAVTHYRKLAEPNANAFLPDLAMSLNNQANMQSAMGQREEALRSISEAVTYYRKLAETNPDAYLHNLAKSLNNQAAMQRAMGQREAALRSIVEAMKHYRKVAEANPDAFLPDLAASLNNQAATQRAIGQLEAAVWSITEAVKIRRKLAEANPDAFLPDLAGSLNNQANMQNELGQREAAVRSIAEAATLYRKLAEASPDAFLPDLAMSLNNQANMQSGMERREPALRFIAEAATIRRRLAEANPDAFLPDLAISYGAWGRVLREGEPALAAEKFGEGLRLIVPLAVRLPEAHLETAIMLARDYIATCEEAKIEWDADLIPFLTTIAQLINDRENGGGLPPEETTRPAEV